MTDRQDMANCTDIKSIMISDHINYLGIKLFCDRQKTLNAAKDNVKRYMQYLKGRIQTQNFTLAHILFSAFYRSLLIYFMTPMFAAGTITKVELNSLRAQLIRNQFGIKCEVADENILLMMSLYTH